MPEQPAQRPIQNTVPNPRPTHSSMDDDTNPPPAEPRTDSHPELRDLLSPSQMDDELGRLAQYRVLKVLGRGGMGMVFLAEDSQLMRLAAVKIMLPKYARDAHARERFLREARAAARVKHDFVITIHQVGEENRVPFIAMEFLKGASLEDYLDKKGELSIGQVLRVGRQMAEGLHAAHEQGLVHRDIKPANVFLESPQGRVKILDFGLAREIREDVKLTRAGAVVGTPLFMSPEQARGDELDARSDLFSLGVVLYRLCTGQQPFMGPNISAVLTALAVGIPKPVRELKPQVPEQLARLIHKLLEKDPANRMANASIVVETIKNIQKRINVPGEQPLPEAIEVQARPIPYGIKVAKRPMPVAVPYAQAVRPAKPKPKIKLKKRVPVEDDDEDEEPLTWARFFLNIWHGIFFSAVLLALLAVSMLVYFRR